MNIKILNTFVIVFMLLFGIGVATPSLFVAEATQRAGIIILKQYDDGDWAIMFGEKAGTEQDWKSVNFPAGKSDEGDGGDMLKTAVREAIEETGGPDYSPLKDLTTADLYSKHIEADVGESKIHLYFLNVSAAGDKFKGVGKITLGEGVKSAIADTDLSGAFKEVQDYWAVPVASVIKAAKRVKGSRNIAGKRRFTSRGTGEKLQLEFNYMQALVDNVGDKSNRYQGELIKILEEITGKDFSKS